MVRKTDQSNIFDFLVDKQDGRFDDFSVNDFKADVAGFVADLGLDVVLGENEVEADVFVPEKGVGIDFNDLFGHSESFKHLNYHYDRWKCFRDDGVQLIQVWEDEWINKNSVVKSMLAHKLGVSGEHKIYGRSTEVLELSYGKAKHFLDEHHIQGGVTGTLYLGLVADRDIVAVMVLKQRSEGVWELVRYATGLQVIGGFSKLLKYFERNFEWQENVSFADLCVSDGGLYVKHGFRLDKVLEPDYRYIVDGGREHKFGYRLHRFRSDPGLEYEDGLTERELAKLNGLLRVYDAGKQRWVKTNS